jgi:hypothetical protein
MGSKFWASEGEDRKIEIKRCIVRKRNFGGDRRKR